MTILEKKPTLQIENTKLEGVKLITPPTIFDDFRGDYIEIYNQKLYQENGITPEFVQDDYATSSKHVLRGIHGDDQTIKLVSCIYGTLYIIIVNHNPHSSQYKQWTSFNLSGHTRKQLFVPANFGISYLVMSDEAVFHYKQSTYYHETTQFTIKWNDPEYRFWWPVNSPITSQRDEGLI